MLSLEIKNQVEAVIYFLQRMDVEMISDILDEHNYQDFEKNIFINKLDEALLEFKEAGDTFLEFYEGHCNNESCNFNCTGYQFRGNNSGKQMSLIFQVKDERVADLYECGEFKTVKKLAYGERVWINKFEIKTDFPGDTRGLFD